MKKPLLASAQRLFADRSLWIPAALFLLLILLELAVILHLNHQEFSYSLDDAYIHLALAERIHQGHYGINSGEAAAPSSSILWPFLLAPFAGQSWFSWLPLLLNVLAGLVVLAMTGRFWNSFFSARSSGTPALAANLLMIFCLNLVGLSFTGMEHLWQLVMTLAIALALLRSDDGREPGALFFLAVVVGPLLRYENAGLSAIALLWLLIQRRYRAFIVLSILTVLPLGLFSLYLHSLGLSWFPSSVMAKSVSVFGGSSSLIANLMLNLNHRQALVLMAAIVLLLVHAFSSRRRALPLLAVMAACGHLILGRFGWWDRYEIYILAFLLFIFAAAYQHHLQRLNRWLIVSVILIIFLPYIINMLYTPLGCNNMYQQQRQMARFVKQEWPAPVAVNDLGWVAFGNPDYILDLWGLASPQVLQVRRQQHSSSWMDSLARSHNVRLAMIYEVYFPLLPETWTCVGKLFLGRRKMTADQPMVSFYATRPEEVDDLKRHLRHFKPSLPPGVRLHIAADTHSTEKRTP